MLKVGFGPLRRNLSVVFGKYVRTETSLALEFENLHEIF